MKLLCNMGDVVFFAKTNFRNQEVKFGILSDDRRRHMYVIGKTGMGKTSLIQNLAIQDIWNGQGVCIIDPHGDFATACLHAVPSHRINDVLYFDPADTSFPVAFNIMNVPHYASKDLTASEVVNVFKKLFADSCGYRLENTLRHAILSLMAYQNTTLIEVLTLLLDENYREKIIAAETDPILKQFWVKQFSEYRSSFRAEVVEPVQNKISQFLANPIIRNIIGQPNSKFDVREMMDKRKIIILNLSKGRLGDDNSALLGALMVSKIQLAALSRADVPEIERPDFYLYIDEFQNFCTSAFLTILSEARKYHLNLILSHQYMMQLDESTQHAIIGNTGTQIAFRIGAWDAEFLEKEFLPNFTSIDLINLDKFQIYLKLSINGQTGTAFSATTLKPFTVEGAGVHAEKIIRCSRERYTRPVEKVSQEIRSRIEKKIKN